MSEDQKIECVTHGSAFQTFVCNHLADSPAQTWYSNAPSAENEWPDSWCSECHELYLRENEWNDSNEGGLNVKLLCHRCYGAIRALGDCVTIPDGERTSSDSST